MTTYAFLPGAGGDATWLFARVAALLEDAGHETRRIDFPADDDSAGLPEYAELTVRAIGDRTDVVLVAQSMSGFTAPLVAQRVTLKAIVLLNAMIPAPGETPNEWWGNVDSESARVAAAERGGYSTEIDLDVYFTHDVPPDVLAGSAEHQRNESEAAFRSPCAIRSWPDVPTTVVAGADDRFFPVEFQQRVARDRLGIEADVLPGGHLLAASQPKALAEYLLGL